MDNIEFVVGNRLVLENISTVPAWKPFDDRIIDFCGRLSDELNKERRIRLYPDLVSLAFWLRKNNIKQVCKRYTDMDHHLGKGLIFHIAPGNVALSFAYSMLSGLLTGNTNIVRLPSRKFDQAELFSEILTNTLKEYNEIASRICLIKYPHDKSITDKLSSICHMRIIWGGDNTINTIRQSPINPRATEITFADRFSICLIDADMYLSDYSPKKAAHDFYIDTYLTDQNACSSPRIICWLGKNIEDAKMVFWNSLYDEISGYEMASVTTVDKMILYSKYLAYNNARVIIEKDYRIVRVEVDVLDNSILDNLGNSGFFYECNINTLDDILPICTWKLQTLTYIGIEKETIKNFVISNAPSGIDRILPIGKTMDYSFIADGYDIVREMTREIL